MVRTSALVALVLASSCPAFAPHGARHLDGRGGPPSVASFQRVRLAVETLDPSALLLGGDRDTRLAGALLGPVRGGAATLAAALVRACPRGVAATTALRADGALRVVFDVCGTPVWPTSILVSSSPAGRLMAVGVPPSEGRVLPGSHPPASAAVAAARSWLGGGQVRRPSRPILFDTDGGLLPAALVGVATTRPPAEQWVVVDGAGTVVACRPASAPADHEGVASCYDTHPLAGEPVQRPVDHLLKASRLDGRHFVVENDDTTVAASGTNGRFVYEPGNKHFDEANVYRHLDRMHDWTADVLGFDAVPRLAVAVWYGDGYDNAMYMGWGDCIVFGDGERYNVLSRDASVIYHEYAHAVTAAAGGPGSFGEAGALNEGFSDYFAATLTECPDVGVWVVAPTGRPYLRTCANATHYPEDLTGESHDDSRIWSGALWDLRGRLGAAVVDVLAHRCRFRLDDGATFAAGLAALRLADDEAFGGVHDGVIVEVLAARGLAAGDGSLRRAFARRARYELLERRTK